MTSCLDDHAPAAVAALNLPDHPDLAVLVNSDQRWLYVDAPASLPADYELEWTETFKENGEVHYPRRWATGTFDDLSTRLAAVLKQPARATDYPVELVISQWALRYKRIGA